MNAALPLDIADTKEKYITWVFQALFLCDKMKRLSRVICHVTKIDKTVCIYVIIVIMTSHIKQKNCAIKLDKLPVKLKRRRSLDKITHKRP